MYDYAIVDSGYCEAFSYVEGFDSGDVWGLIANLSWYSWKLVLLSYVVNLGLDACLHIKI